MWGWPLWHCWGHQRVSALHDTLNGTPSYFLFHINLWKEMMHLKKENILCNPSLAIFTQPRSRNFLFSGWCRSGGALWRSCRRCQRCVWRAFKGVMGVYVARKSVGGDQRMLKEDCLEGRMREAWCWLCLVWIKFALSPTNLYYQNNLTRTSGNVGMPLHRIIVALSLCISWLVFYMNCMSWLCFVSCP